MKLSTSTVQEVAALFSVAPRTLLRAVAKNWETGMEGAACARQIILAAANADGPGMASRGEWAMDLIRCLLLPRFNPYAPEPLSKSYERYCARVLGLPQDDEPERPIACLMPSAWDVAVVGAKLFGGQR